MHWPPRCRSVECRVIKCAVCGCSQHAHGSCKHNQCCSCLRTMQVQRTQPTQSLAPSAATSALRWAATSSTVLMLSSRHRTRSACGFLKVCSKDTAVRSTDITSSSAMHVQQLLLEPTCALLPACTCCTCYCLQPLSAQRIWCAGLCEYKPTMAPWIYE